MIRFITRRLTKIRPGHIAGEAEAIRTQLGAFASGRCVRERRDALLSIRASVDRHIDALNGFLEDMGE